MTGWDKDVVEMCRLGAVIGELGAARPFVESFRELARTNPHGHGIGGFVDGAAKLERSVASALEDRGFGAQEWLPDARSAVMHVRKATSGAPSVENTHPFHVGDRIFAHNGTFGELVGVDSRLGDDLARLGVRGDTDSERLSALFQHESAAAGGDEVEGYRRAVEYLSDRHPMTSLTSISVAPDGTLTALRYPENRTLFLKRLGPRDAADGHRLLAPVPGASEPGLTVLASRPLDASAGWTELRPGTMLRIRADDLAEETVDVTDLEPARRYTDEHHDNGLPWTGRRRATMVPADFDG